MGGAAGMAGGTDPGWGTLGVPRAALWVLVGDTGSFWVWGMLGGYCGMVTSSRDTGEMLGGPWSALGVLAG